MFKTKIEYILSALLVLVAIFSILGKRITLNRLDKNYQNATGLLEENFRTLYLSKHLRVLSHNLNVHGTRYFLTQDEDDKKKLQENRTAFFSTINESKLEVSIHDNGPGIAENDLPHIFDRFWQAKNTAKKGTGLGLAIVKGLVGAHGGNIWVVSKSGEGTSFFFTLPLQQHRI